MLVTTTQLFGNENIKALDMRKKDLKRRKIPPDATKQNDVELRSLGVHPALHYASAHFFQSKILLCKTDPVFYDFK